MFDSDTDPDQPYKGPERRNGEVRRTKADRRKDIRFEMKDDRRQKPGRREGDKDPWFKHEV